MNESRTIHAADDWAVVLQSVPSKSKKEIVKRLEEIFELDKRDAEQILSNTPLILLDNLSFGLAARIKKFFQKIGAVAETTNHDMIKKNCFQVVWPQTPELSFFMKSEMGPAEILVQGKQTATAPAEISSVVPKSVNEAKPRVPEAPEASLSPGPVPMKKDGLITPETPAKSEDYGKKSEAPKASEAPVPRKPVQESPAVSQFLPVSEKPNQKSPEIEKSTAVPSPGVDLDWEKRAKELHEKLQKIHEAKQELHSQHVEATEKVKNAQQRLEEQKNKNEEITKAYKDLQKEVQKHEVLSREGEEWRSRAIALDEKIRELERSLSQKTSAIEQLIQQKEELARQSEKAAAETQQELLTLRNRELEFFRKIEGLERNIQEMTESLRSRDGAVIQIEKQILELSEKVQGYELLRQEHEQLLKEHSTIRREYDIKLNEQGTVLAKTEEDHRRYRSRADRKNAAATRELGELIRGMDGIRQGLQKLVFFLGSESAILDSEKKSTLRAPLSRTSDTPNMEKS